MVIDDFFDLKRCIAQHRRNRAHLTAQANRVLSGTVADERMEAQLPSVVQVRNRRRAPENVDSLDVAVPYNGTPGADRLGAGAVAPLQLPRGEPHFHRQIVAAVRPRRYLPSMTHGDLIDAALEENAIARAELVEACDALSEPRRLERWFGANAWSLHDIVAHIAVWQDAAARGLEQLTRGEAPDIEGWHGDDDTYNAATIELFASAPWPEVLTALRHARERHAAAAEAARDHLADAAFEEGGQGRRLLFLPSTHDREHVPAILEWRRARGY